MASERAVVEGFKIIKFLQLFTTYINIYHIIFTCVLIIIIGLVINICSKYILKCICYMFNISARSDTKMVKTVVISDRIYRIPTVKCKKRRIWYKSYLHALLTARLISTILVCSVTVYVLDVNTSIMVQISPIMIAIILSYKGEIFAGFNIMFWYDIVYDDVIYMDGHDVYYQVKYVGWVKTECEDITVIMTNIDNSCRVNPGVVKTVYINNIDLVSNKIGMVWYDINNGKSICH